MIISKNFLMIRCPQRGGAGCVGAGIFVSFPEIRTVHN